MPRTEELGDATLYLGDCREIVPTLGPLGSVISDPPYGMEFRSNYRKVKHNHIVADDTEWPLEFAIGLPARYSTYVFCRWDNVWQWPAKPRSLIWVKNNWSMGDLEHEHGRQTEMVMFFAGPEHSFPKLRPTDFIEAPRTGNNHHPTEKPVQLMHAICGWAKGPILDPFMGSGSTGLGALRAGHKFVGIEVDEKHFDIACRRFEAETKQNELF